MSSDVIEEYDDDMEKPKRIGEMNGPWRMLLQIALATYPIVVMGGGSWLTWATLAILANQHFVSSQAFSRIEAAEMEARLREMSPALSQWVNRMDAAINVLEKNDARQDVRLDAVEKKP